MTSVDSSNEAKILMEEALMSDTTWSRISAPISSILLRITLSDRGICCTFFEASTPWTAFTIYKAQGMIRVSAIVCGFFAFSTLYAALYDIRSRSLSTGVNHNLGSVPLMS